jgi:serine/threonine protein kinase
VELSRQGLTNAQIAERAGKSVDQVRRLRVSAMELLAIRIRMRLGGSSMGTCRSSRCRRMDDLTVREELLRIYMQDLEAGEVRPMSQYLALFPEHAEVDSEVLGRIEGAPPSASGALGTVAHYHLLRELGRGGQGEVYLAQDERLRRIVALKVLRGLGDETKDLLDRFRREAEVASRLDHPGICTVFDSGEAGGVAYIAMRFVEGETLAQRIARARSTTATAEEVASGSTSGLRTRAEVMGVVNLIEKAARALHAAHEASVVHRDVKPANLMITPEGDPVILDFGLAQDLAGGSPTLTRSGLLLGSAPYMSPEQILGRCSRLDRRTDVYSLGVTLYEALTLQRPFHAATREALYRKILPSC